MQSDHRCHHGTGLLHLFITQHLQSVDDVLRFVGEDLADEVHDGAGDSRRGSRGAVSGPLTDAIRWMTLTSSRTKEPAQGSVSSDNAVTGKTISSAMPGSCSNSGASRAAWTAPSELGRPLGEMGGPARGAGRSGASHGQGLGFSAASGRR